MSKMIDRTNKMRQGPGLDESTDIGPVVSKEQQERVLNYINIAQKKEPSWSVVAMPLKVI